MNKNVLMLTYFANQPSGLTYFSGLLAWSSLSLRCPMPSIMVHVQVYRVINSALASRSSSHIIFNRQIPTQPPLILRINIPSTIIIQTLFCVKLHVHKYAGISCIARQKSFLDVCPIRLRYFFVQLTATDGCAAVSIYFEALDASFTTAHLCTLCVPRYCPSLCSMRQR